MKAKDDEGAAAARALVEGLTVPALSQTMFVQHQFVHVERVPLVAKGHHKRGGTYF